MQKLYLELRPFYQKFLKRNESYIINTLERHDLTLSFFVKLLGIVLFLQSGVINYSNIYKNNTTKDFRKLLHNILFHSLDSIKFSIFGGSKVFQSMFDLSYLESQMKDALSVEEWDDLITILLKYKYTLKESFEEEIEEDITISPEFLSYFVESILNDYERLLSLKIKPKLSRRKNRGTFYTPWTIVRNITTECFSALFKDNQNKYSNDLRFLDSACGTGSFLIYTAETICDIVYSQGFTKQDLINILQHNLYGVDTSNNSISVAKMRLLFWMISKTDAIPPEIPNDLFRNFKVGNSLFGLIDEAVQYPLDYKATLERVISKIPKFTSQDNAINWLKVSEYLREATTHADEQISDLPEAYQLMKRLLDNLYLNWLRQRLDKVIAKKLKIPDLIEINIFHWGLEFPEVVNSGGFDCILGNPPYGRSVLTPKEKKYIKVLYKSCFGKNKKYSLNSASAFIERSIHLLKKKGILGFILPYSILRVEEFERLRSFILSETQIISITDEANAFSDVTLEMCSLTLIKQKSRNYSIKIHSRNGVKAKRYVQSSVFSQYNRFMIYYDELWESCCRIGKINIVSGDYGIDHRIIGKDVTPIHSSKYHVIFLHSGRCVKKYGLNPKYFLFSKPHPNNIRFNIYFKEPRLISTAIGNKLRVAYKPEKIIPGTNVSILEVPQNYHYFPMLIILNSDLINYLLKRYILNFSSLTIYLHKYYTKLIPIKYPFEHEKIWKILASYLLFLTQLNLSKDQNFDKRIKYLENLSNYLVYEMYFPEFSNNEEKLVTILESVLKPINLNPFFDLMFEISTKSNTDNETLSHIIEVNKKVIF
ncbi:MAG: Eco57I restriction-modification methylase domain-containing protein, partial [Candidatus Hodarchaeales archaeon]